MVSNEDAKASKGGLGEYFRLLPSRISNELTNNPIGISLGVISALSVFAKSPSTLDRSVGAVELNLLSSVYPESVISWMLVSFAGSFVLSRIGASMIKRRLWSGLLFSVVFGTFAVLISTYLAIEYLAPTFGITDPQLHLSDSLTDRAKVWSGIHIQGIVMLCVLMWAVNAISAYGSEVSNRSAENGPDGVFTALEGEDSTSVIYFAGVAFIFPMMGIGLLSNAVLEGTASAFVDAVLWKAGA